MPEKVFPEILKTIKLINLLLVTIRRSSWCLEDLGEDAVWNASTVLVPALAILAATVSVVSQLSMDQKCPEVDGVKPRNQVCKPCKNKTVYLLCNVYFIQVKT